jgi:hypothetical protein
MYSSIYFPYGDTKNSPNNKSIDFQTRTPPANGWQLKKKFGVAQLKMPTVTKIQNREPDGVDRKET